MKSLLLLLLVSILVGIGCSSDIQRVESRKEHMALGWLERDAFVNDDFPAFKQVYDTVAVGPDFVEMIKVLGHDVEYLVVLGTWCSDSKREVPRFLKIIDLAGIAPERVKYYGVDRTKQSPGELPGQYNIELVPTIIVLKNGSEMGRIVESPKNSIEEDLLVILAEAQNR